MANCSYCEGYKNRAIACESEVKSLRNKEQENKRLLEENVSLKTNAEFWENKYKAMQEMYRNAITR